MTGRAATSRRTVLLVTVPGAVALVAAMTLRIVVVGLYLVPSASMAPTLVAGDRIVVDKLAYRRRGPSRGDVVVLVAPSGLNFVKRVVALAGDTVALRDKQLVLDGRPVPDESLGDAQLDAAGELVASTAFFRENELFRERLESRTFRVVRRRAVAPRDFGPVTVPVGSIFVLGDNRDASIDSRTPSFGTIPLSRLVGRVVRISYSFGPRGLRRARLFAPVR